MLVLTRKKNESIMIGDQIELVVLDINDTQVRLGITAPKHVNIHRKEVYEAILQASTSSAETSSNAVMLKGKMKSFFEEK